MPSGKLLASPSLQVDKLIPRPDLVEIVASCRGPVASCPVCGTSSRRVQSCYSRTLADLPWHGVPVTIRLRVRRFFCDAEACSRKVFAERAFEIGNEFQAIVRGQKIECLDAWLQRARCCGIAALEGFAVGLEKERKAVEASLSYHWSNGQVEGQVNRLKLIKRSMYARAKFDLLRARVLR